MKTYMVKLSNSNPVVIVEIIIWDERQVLEMSHEFC